MKENIEFSKPLKGDDWETSSHYTLPNGTSVDKKPEAMTQLIGNILVYKDDPRIALRGKLDTFQSELIQGIAIFRELKAEPLLLEQLKELLDYARTILGHEVLQRVMPEQKLLSWSADEIRERSHHPHQFYGLKQMVLINDEFSHIVIALNVFRAKIREIELVAVSAFREGDEIKRNDLVLALNRMSSCFHILMYQEIARDQK